MISNTYAHLRRQGSIQSQSIGDDGLGKYCKSTDDGVVGSLVAFHSQGVLICSTDVPILLLPVCELRIMNCMNCVVGIEDNQTDRVQVQALSISLDMPPVDSRSNNTRRRIQVLSLPHVIPAIPLT